MTRQDIEHLRRKMREAAAQADKADREWNELNDAFKVKIELENQQRRRSGRLPHSALDVVKQKSDFLALSDAFAVQGWFRTQAMYYASLIQAELAADQLLRKESPR